MRKSILSSRLPPATAENYFVKTFRGVVWRLYVGQILDLVRYILESVDIDEKKLPAIATRLPRLYQCFLSQNGYHVFSASCRIRVFEKRLRIHEVTCILVEIAQVGQISD